MEWQRYEFRVSTDPRLLQFAVIHDFLRQTYWANEISESVLKKALGEASATTRLEWLKTGD